MTVAGKLPPQRVVDGHSINADLTKDRSFSMAATRW